MDDVQVIVVVDGPEWAWAQCVYLSHHHRKAAFAKVVAWAEQHRGTGMSITSGEIDGRPNVCIGVPAEHAALLGKAPWGPDAIAIPVGTQQAQACYLRNRRQAPLGPGIHRSHHGPQAAEGRAYLHPDGELGEKL